MAYCDRCDRYFTNDRALQQHEENSSMHNICHRCQKDFSSEWGLTQHYVQSPIHHYCQRCDDHFRSAHDLTSHYEDVHYYCQICNSVRVGNVSAFGSSLIFYDCRSSTSNWDFMSIIARSTLIVLRASAFSKAKTI
ncbi:hypothetical protein AcV7_003301 [Taiwanofungus camphoratus]|nr:hypothetical protein AcV7_003301 [Antrodia cinnamomea]